MKKNPFERLPYLINFLNHTVIGYVLFVAVILSLIIFIETPEKFYNNMFFLVIESSFAYIFLLYFVNTYNVFIQGVIAIIEILLRLIISIRNKKVVRYTWVDYNLEDMQKYRDFFSKTFIPSFIFLLIVVFYTSFVQGNMFSSNYLLDKFTYLGGIYILLVNFFVFVLIFHEHFSKHKLKLNFSLYDFSLPISIIILFFVSFGFAGIEINKLNNNDLVKYDYLNCTYPTASKNLVIKNETINCIFNDYNKSSNYSVSFQNGFQKINLVTNATFLEDNKTMIFKVPERENIYYTLFLVDNKILYIIEELRIVSYDKFLYTTEEIESDKKEYLIGAWIFFFTSIIFIIEIEKRFKNIRI